MKSGRITLYRSGSWREGAQRYRVWIDGRRVGVLSSDGSLSVEVEPGVHTVCARTRWFRGGMNTVTVAEDERKWIYVGVPTFDPRRPASSAGSPVLVVE
ncbi:MAG: hypothetical protein QOC66_814 [Pseudonocardiales bacterium]|jgi:hypothetical protein|nr:hypothetical protein [Pseudonocardiales bacterium]